MVMTVGCVVTTEGMPVMTPRELVEERYEVCGLLFGKGDCQWLFSRCARLRRLTYADDVDVGIDMAMLLSMLLSML